MLDTALVAQRTENQQGASVSHGCAIELPFRKVALVGVLKNVLYVVARITQPVAKFNCHAFQVKAGSASAEAFAFALAAYSESMFRRTTAARASMRNPGNSNTSEMCITGPVVVNTGSTAASCTSPQEDKARRNSLLLEDFGFGSALDDIEALLESPVGTPVVSPTTSPKASPPPSPTFSQAGLFRRGPSWGSSLSVASQFDSMMDLTLIPRGSYLTTTVDDTTSETGSTAEEPTCQLCMRVTTGDRWVTLKFCTHEFHYHCLQCWRGDGNNLCPMCHACISKSQLYAEYTGRKELFSPSGEPNHAQVAAAAHVSLTGRGYTVRMKVNGTSFRFENVGSSLVLRSKYHLQDIIRLDRLDPRHIGITVAPAAEGSTIDRITPEGDVRGFNTAEDDFMNFFTVVCFRCQSTTEADNLFVTLGTTLKDSNFGGCINPPLQTEDE